MATSDVIFVRMCDYLGLRQRGHSLASLGIERASGCTASSTADAASPRIAVQARPQSGIAPHQPVGTAIAHALSVRVDQLRLAGFNQRLHRAA